MKNLAHYESISVDVYACGELLPSDLFVNCGRFIVVFFSVDCGRFNTYGTSKRGTVVLFAGEQILQRFKDDEGTLIVVDEASMLFKIQSLTSESQWYVVSMQSNYCDYPDWSSICKHIIGVQLILKECFPHLYSIMPIVDSVRAMANLPVVEDTNNDGMSLHLNEVDALGSPPTNIDVLLDASIEEFKSHLEKLQEKIHTFSLADKEATL